MQRRDSQKNGGAEPGPALLTPRQLEVLELLAKGLTNREIADVLGITRGTAKIHVSAVIDALEVTNRTEAAMALRDMRLGSHATSPEGEAIPGFGSRPAIAVLPFTSLGDDASHEVFADGLTEDLITTLAGWRWFPVIARNSSFAYKGQAVDVTQVARNLGARYVIEGSSRREADQVRIHLQLLDGLNGRHLLAERFDRQLGDVFAVQDEISEAIFGILEPTLVQLESLRAVRRSGRSQSAWDSFQRGMHYLQKQTPDELPEARAWFERAIQSDPQFAPAHANLAICLFGEGMFAMVSNAPEEESSDEPGADLEHAGDCYRASLEAATRAVELDPMDSSGHAALGGARAVLGDRAAGTASLERALELNPSSASASFALGIVSFVSGDGERAAALLERALRLSPRDPMLHHFLGALSASYLLLQRDEEALATSKRGARIEPPGSVSYRPVTVLALSRLGRDAEARETLGRDAAAARGLRFASAFAPPALAAELSSAFERLGAPDS